MRVGFCGSGAWGITLADLIARNGHEVLLWSIEEDVLVSLEKGKGHPKFPDLFIDASIRYTRHLKDLLDTDVIVECVTAKGFRPVLKEFAALGGITKPFIITSKGIEQETGKLLVEVAYELLKKEELIGYMSGPTLAREVMLQHITAAVAASPNKHVIEIIKKLFQAPYFQVYTNKDIYGVALGGAMKNVIAIASGLAEGMGYGHNTKALIITRGLSEIRQMAKVKGANENTCFGLSGIGDLIVTGVSNLSRNFSFGMLLGKGISPEEAKKQIGMIVEGEYTVLSAWNLGQKYKLDLPITNAMYQIIYKGKEPKKALKDLLENDSKEE
jgi:glycerol-3-phosphate dehydrogenase (NAD(P)+)